MKFVFIVLTFNTDNTIKENIFDNLEDAKKFQTCINSNKGDITECSKILVGSICNGYYLKDLGL